METKMLKWRVYVWIYKYFFVTLFFPTSAGALSCFFPIFKKYFESLSFISDNLELIFFNSSSPSNETLKRGKIVLALF